MKPLAIELFCGSFGWSAGWLELGGRAIGFDIEHLPHHGPVPENAELVLQDVTTLHGSQFKDASIIFASPPCQNYSYLAMPWSRSPDIVRPCGDGWEILNSRAAKEMLEEWRREGPDNRLFDACFRIQREASEAACRYIPLIVENVRGAQPWVGRSAWNYGSFHLWGDVPALMPITLGDGVKVPGQVHGAEYALTRAGANGQTVLGTRKDSNGHSRNDGGDEQPGSAVGSVRLRDGRAGAQTDGEVLEVLGQKTRTGGGWFGDGKHGETRKADPQDVRLQSDGSWMTPDGTKIGGDWFSDPNSTCRKHGSRSSARKAASAQIARIPFELSSHIARVYFPR